MHSMNKYLTVNRLEFMVTYQCNSNCKHCQILKEEKSILPKQVDKDLAQEIVRKVSEKYHSESIMTFGGEPLLHPEVVYAIHAAAKQSGIPGRELITNGYWSKDKSEIKLIANNLVKAGANEVSISVDSFHAEHIPIELVRESAKALLEAKIDKIKWNPCWLVSEDHDNEWNRRTKSILKELSDLSIEISSGNYVKPEGNALNWLKEFLPPKTQIPKGKCEDIPYAEPLDSVHGISVEPDGQITVCNELPIGNANDTDIIKIVENYDPYQIPEIKAIVQNGMNGLIDWARQYGVEPDSKGYYSICDMCITLRRRVNERK